MQINKDKKLKDGYLMIINVNNVIKIQQHGIVQMKKYDIVEIVMKIHIKEEIE